MQGAVKPVPGGGGLVQDGVMAALCRDCQEAFGAGTRCPACRSPRVIAHDELFDLGIAHLDCDAFYASVEKRDNPELRDRPVIVGGGRRGVVSTACYIARIHGVRSAMPMFQALRLCPDAVVLAPRFDAYVEASRAIRARMEALTPAVEPLSLDEAFMDLRGTARLHGVPPAVLLARLAWGIAADLGLSVSIGLSHNKFLAKLASDMDKPRGFSVIGRAETAAFLYGKPVGMIWGVGAALEARLQAEGIRRVDDLLVRDKADLVARFGGMGARLWHLARGEDTRTVTPDALVKSISKETTLPEDVTDPDLIDGHLWRLAEQVADRAKARALAGEVVMLKLKRANHRILSRRVTVSEPVQLADTIYRHVRALFDRVGDGGPFRLIGVGIAGLAPASGADPMADLADPDAPRRAAAERALDRIRARYGAGAIIKGRSLR